MSAIRNEPKIKNPLIVAIREQLEHRALWMYLLCDEAKKKGLSFRFDFDEAPVQLQIREQDAQRLFGNLISNAVRYANSEIRLSCHRKENTADIRVADDGPGIRPEDLPHIFERFYKGRDGKHGIGLAIARSVAEAYRGTICARNENGAVFEVTFPTDR